MLSSFQFIKNEFLFNVRFHLSDIVVHDLVRNPEFRSNIIRIFIWNDLENEVNVIV